MSKPIKVLHVTFDMGIGGTEQVIKNLIYSTRSQFIEHHIACLEKPIGPWGEDLEKSGISIHKFQRQPKLTWGLIAALRSTILNNEIDIVHSHQYSPFIYGFLASRLTPAKIIFTEHGRFYPDIVSAKRKLINKLIFPFVDSVTSISKATKQALIENETIRGEKISVIYNGIEPIPDSKPEEIARLRTKHDIPENSIILGAVARLDSIKNQLYMIREFAKSLIDAPNLTLIIVGDGPERKNIEALVEELELTNKVVLTGFISAPAAYFNMFDVFLLPSLSEGTSMTLLEAMSAGKQSIVSNVGGNPEIINQSFLGKVIDNENDSLAKAVAEVVDQTPNEKTQKEIQDWFSRYYSTSTFSDAFTVLYNQLIGFKGKQYDTRTK